MVSFRSSAPVCASILTAVIASVAASAEVTSPAPGSVYREIKIHISNSGDQWRVTDPNATNAGSPGNSPADFLPNPTIGFDIPSGVLNGATSAVAILDYWGGHVGTIGQRMRFNSNAWRSLPELQTTPTDAECYMQQWNPSVTIPISDLRTGNNTLQGTSDGQTCFNFRWGQWGWYGVILRLYYDPATVANPTGSIASPGNNATIGENPTIQVETSGGVQSVEVLARFDGPDWDGDGDFNEYHQAYHRPKSGTQLNTTGHVGTDTAAPFNVVWNTELVPDQNNIRLIARIQGTNGLWYVTPAKTGISLARDDGSVLHFKPFDVPRRFWTRNNSALRNLESKVNIPNSVNLNQINWARMIVRTWNGNDGGAESGQTHGTWLNNNRITTPYGAGHHYSIDVIPIPVSWLDNGDNVFRFDSSSTHHGIEILWPGPELVVGSTQIVDSSCGDGIQDPDEECDDGNDVDGDGCDSDCTLSDPGGGNCGDGTQDPGEECDDGNNVDGDGCQSDCTLPLEASRLPALYPFEGSGSTIDDVANGNDGTLVPDGQRTGGGRYGSAVVFNGNSGHVNLGPLNFGGPFTIAMWIKPHDFGVSDARLISKATGTSNNAHFFMVSTVNSDGRRLRFRLKTTNGGTTTLIATGATLSAGSWVHVAAVWTGSQMRLFQDGVQVGSIGKSGSVIGDAAVEVWVGDQTNGGKPFDGEIDELVLDGRAYTASEIVTLMNTPITQGGPDCGNGVLDPGEGCDDGNTTDGDGCQGDCQLPVCGDGITDAGEQCDDGNVTSGDGCQANCLLPVCGDNVQDPGEACDDGNNVDGDGCSGDCSTVGGTQPGNVLRNPDFAGGTADWRFYSNGNAGFTTPGGEARLLINTAGSNVQLYQRDVAVAGARQYMLRFRGRASRERQIRVDLRQHVSPYDSYGLSQTFTLGTTMAGFEVLFTTTGGDKTDGRFMIWLSGDIADGDDVYLDDFVLAPPSPCGDGTVDAGEECDDGNTTAGDGCDALCRIEACGDGTVDAGEECDDGNTTAGDGCDALCRIEACGDGTVDAGEECDDGNTTAGDGCDALCRIEACGNGRIDAGEECDDGNGVDDDGCSNDCLSNDVGGGDDVVVNGDFSAGDAPWRFYTNGQGSFDTNDGFARVTISTQGSNIQLYQRNIAIEGATTYRLRFRARNTAGADMDVWLRQHTSPYTSYGLNAFIDLTDGWQEFTVDFTTTAGFKPDARLVFWFGPYELAGAAYEIDDVELFALP